MRVPDLRTERLLIREFTLADLSAIHALLDTELVDGLELEGRRRWLEWTVLGYAELAVLHQPPYGDRAIVRSTTNELIGACGYAPCLAPFHQIPGFANAPQHGYSAEVGMYWAVSQRHQRQGYATEAARALIDHAFDTLQLQRLVGTTTYDNAASIGVMRRLGMRIERNSMPEPDWLQIVGVLENSRV